VEGKITTAVLLAGTQTLKRKFLESIRYNERAKPTVKRHIGASYVVHACIQHYSPVLTPARL
jgi:hypothetical protein